VFILFFPRIADTSYCSYVICQNMPPVKLISSIYSSSLLKQIESFPLLLLHGLLKPLGMRTLFSRYTRVMTYGPIHRTLYTSYRKFIYIHVCVRLLQLAVSLVSTLQHQTRTQTCRRGKAYTKGTNDMVWNERSLRPHICGCILHVVKTLADISFPI
jgi:hypothetical protein